MAGLPFNPLKPQQNQFPTLMGNLSIPNFIGAQKPTIPSFATPAPVVAPQPLGPSTKPAMPSYYSQPLAQNSPVRPPMTSTAPMPTVPQTNPNQSRINEITGQISGIKSQLYDLGQSATPTAPTAPTAPVAPPPPQTTPAVPNLTSQYEQQVANYMTPSAQESTLANQLADLEGATNLGVSGLEGQGRGIPLELVRGQQAKLQEQGLLQQQTLQQKLAIEQAKRQSSLELSKYQLDREDERVASEKESRATAAKYQYELDKPMEIDGQVVQRQADGSYKSVFTAPKVEKPMTAIEKAKFDEDVRQFGLTYAQKEKALAIEKQKADAATPAPNPANVMNQINLVKTSITNAEALSGASGRSGIRKAAESWFKGSSDYTNLVAETNSLRTNVLTMMTDPSIKKFFGPQMSNADVQLMTSAGTTLNPELQSPERLITELGRLKELVQRAELAVNQGSQNYQSGADDEFLKQYGL